MSEQGNLAVFQGPDSKHCCCASLPHMIVGMLQPKPQQSLTQTGDLSLKPEIQTPGTPFLFCWKECWREELGSAQIISLRGSYC